MFGEITVLIYKIFGIKAVKICLFILKKKKKKILQKKIQEPN